MMQPTKYAFAALCMFLLLPAGFSQEEEAEAAAEEPKAAPQAAPVRASSYTKPVAAAAAPVRPAAAPVRPAAAAAAPVRPAAAAAAAAAAPVVVEITTTTTTIYVKPETAMETTARKLKEEKQKEEARFKAKYNYDMTVHESMAGVVGKTFAKFVGALGAELSAAKNGTAIAKDAIQKKIDEAKAVELVAGKHYMAEPCEKDQYMSVLMTQLKKHGQPDPTRGHFAKYFDQVIPAGQIHHRRLSKYGEPEVVAGRPAPVRAATKAAEL